METSLQLSSGSFIVTASNSGGIWISEDSGLSFEQNGNFYLSTDFGTSWTIPNHLRNSGSWMAVSVSSSGQYMAAALYGTGVFVSRNYGVSWSKTFSSSFYYFSSLAIDTSGLYIILATLFSGTYLSTDSGSTWAVVHGLSTSYEWQSVAIDQTGQYMYVGIQRPLGVR